MSCSTVLLGMAAGPQIIKKLHAFLEPNIHYRIHNCPPFCLNPVHASSYHLILFYHLHLCLLSGHFFSGVHTKTHRELLSTRYMPRLSIFYLLTPIIFPEEYAHTCPKLYLQMHSVMLHIVITTHQLAIHNNRTVLLL